MYEALDRSAQIYSDSPHCKEHTVTISQMKKLWCAIITICLITIILLAVISYMLFWLVPGGWIHGSVYDSCMIMKWEPKAKLDLFVLCFLG